LANTWHLITDVEEWIVSHNIKQRQNIKKFIFDNLSDIHHYKDIHAKVIVADDKAFIGSSNLTAKGIRERVEMSVLIEEKEQVCELQRWFKELWIGSESVKTQDHIIPDKKIRYASPMLPSTTSFTREMMSKMLDI